MTKQSSAAGFKVEAGVPIPRPPGSTRKGDLKYPFLEMTVGSSFVVPCAPGDANRRASTLRNCFVNFRTNHGHPDWKFAIRPCDGGIRVWRTT